MKKKTVTGKRIAIVLLVLVIAAQLIPVDFENPSIRPENDFITHTVPSELIADNIKSACYDCHSFESKSPWYARIAPASWLMKAHIDEGREHLNFSNWTSYQPKEQIHILEECVEEMTNNEMPLSSYTLIHGKLTGEQKIQVIEFFNQTIKTIDPE